MKKITIILNPCAGSTLVLNWRKSKRPAPGRGWTEHGDQTPPRRQKWKTPLSTSVVGTCSLQTREPPPPQRPLGGRPGRFSGEQPPLYSTPMRLLPGRGMSAGFRAALKFGNLIAPQRNFRAPGSGGSRRVCGPEAPGGRRVAETSLERRRGRRVQAWRQRARGRPGGPGERRLGFPGSAAAWPATQSGGEGAAGSRCKPSPQLRGRWVRATGMPPQSYFEVQKPSHGSFRTPKEQ